MPKVASTPTLLKQLRGIVGKEIKKYRDKVTSLDDKDLSNIKALSGILRDVSSAERDIAKDEKKLVKGLTGEQLAKALGESDEKPEG